MSEKIAFLTYYYPPDQSAGSERSENLIKALTKVDKNSNYWIVTSIPNRYGQWMFNRKYKRKTKIRYGELEVNIKSIWVPFLGNGLIASSISWSEISTLSTSALCTNNFSKSLS